MAELAGEQHGVVSAGQLSEAWLSAATITRWAKSSRLHRLHRGVYAVGHMAMSREGRIMAAVLASPGAVASHRTAAWLHGLRRGATGDGPPHRADPAAPVELTSSSTSRCSRRRTRVEIEGIPVTSPARTVLDLAPEDSRRDLDRMLDRAEELGAPRSAAFESLVARAGTPGAGQVRDAFETFKPDAATLRSDLERRFRDLVLRPGLPSPQTNIFVAGYELDCYWEAEGFAVELDVYATTAPGSPSRKTGNAPTTCSSPGSS